MKTSFLLPSATAVTYLSTVSSFTTPCEYSYVSTRSTTGITHTRSRTQIPTLQAFSMNGAIGGGATTNKRGIIDVTNEYAQRDISTMEQWALSNGAQKVDGLQLISNDSNGIDWQWITQVDIPAGSPILYIPSNMILSSNAIIQEFGDDPDSDGNPLLYAEQSLVKMNKLTAQRLPLFRLFVKILTEYEKGTDSPYYHWLNSLPRRFYNGVAMTDDCFECLPPYASWLASSERDNYFYFREAISFSHLDFDKETLDDDRIMQWAYNVALTRFTEVWQPTRQKLIPPLGDMVSCLCLLGMVVVGYVLLCNASLYHAVYLMCDLSFVLRSHAHPICSSSCIVQSC